VRWLQRKWRAVIVRVMRDRYATPARTALNDRKGFRFSWNFGSL